MKTDALDLEALLVHDGYVRALARKLVFDESAAEDVVQETWLAACDHGPRDRTAARAWLTRIVRNFALRAHRGSMRRDRREREVARPEALPSTEEIVEREAVRKSVVEAVLALDEPYRSVVILRWFEQLDARAIAARLKVPVETVRTRLKRAHELLRARLDGERGDRRAWSLPLVHGMKLEPTPGSTILVAKAALAGVVIMSLSNKVALSLAALVLLLLTFVLVERSVHVPLEPAPDAGHALAPNLERPDEKHDEPTSTLAANERVASTIPGASDATKTESFGSVRVRLSWGDDRTFAAGVWVQILEFDSADPYVDPPRMRTDDQGVARFERVPAGFAAIELDRTQGKSVAITAGKETALDFELERGFDADGLVVDVNGAPIANAQIWLGGLGRDWSFPVTTTAPDGHFHVRSIQAGRSIAATAASFACSPFLYLTASPGARLEPKIVLRGDSGDVEGIVRDPSGAPVAKASVLVGEQKGPRTSKLENESFLFQSSTVSAHTDEAGRFLVRNADVGTLVIQARKGGFAAFRGSVDVVAGGTAHVEIALAPGATLSGSVRDDHGQPVAGAMVHVGSDQDFATVRGRSLVDGSYKVLGVPPGEHEIDAEARKRGHAKTRLAFAGQADVSWDAVLPKSLAIRGRLVDEHDVPLGGWYVGAKRDQGNVASARVDEDGSFTLQNLPEGEYEVVANEPGVLSVSPPAAQKGVRAGSDEVVLRVRDADRATAFIIGFVVGPDGQPVDTATLIPFDGVHGSPILTTEGRTGRFRLGPFPPGRYGLQVTAPGFPAFHPLPHELAAHETWDLGEIRLEKGGTIRCRVHLPEGISEERIQIGIRAANTEDDEWLGIHDGAMTTHTLATGTWHVEVEGASWCPIASDSVEAQVKAGEETAVELALRPGAEVKLAISGGLPKAHVHVHVRDANGRTASNQTWWYPQEGRLKGSVWLTPGGYDVTTTSDTGGIATAHVVVPLTAGEVELLLRKP